MSSGVLTRPPLSSHESLRSPRVSRHLFSMMDDNSSEYEPILPTTSTTKNSPSRQQSRLASRFRWRYAGFEYQKRVWETTARRSHRLRVVAVLQLTLGLLASWNYLWCVLSCRVEEREGVC